MKVRCKIDNFKAIKNNELLTVIRETEDDFVIEKDGMEWYCDKRYFDIVEEPQPEPSEQKTNKPSACNATGHKNTFLSCETELKTTTLEELKKHCKEKIEKELIEIQHYETMITATKQVIKAYEDILERIGE